MSKLVALSEAGSIAIHSMVLIAKSDKLLNVITISECTGSSKHHIAKILQRLVKVGFLKSTRGPSGGFLLDKNPQEIALLDIYEAVEGKIDTPTCPMDKLVCPFQKCIMDNLVNKLTTDFIDFLKGKSLLDYLA